MWNCKHLRHPTDEQLGHVDIFFSNYYNLQSVFFEFELKWKLKDAYNVTQAGRGGAGIEVWNRVYMIAPVKKFGRVRLSSISFKTNMVEKADMEGRWVFAQFLVFLHPNIKKRFSRTFLMEFLDIRRLDVWTVHGWLHLPWFGISASSAIYKLREFLSNQPSLQLSYFPPTVVLITLFLIRNICYELTINY